MVDTKELCGAQSSRGFNQTTASGRPFWSMDPRPEDVRIEDIAAHLSRICRFGGALKDRIDLPYENMTNEEAFLYIKKGAYEHESGEGLCFDVEIYSVAQHSVLVSYNVPQEYALEGLLHDAAEAYIGDMIKPIKSQLVPDFEAIEEILYACGVQKSGAIAAEIMDAVPNYKRIEKRVDAAIRYRFGLPAEESEFVKVADYRAVLTEHRDLQADTGAVDWGVAKLPPFEEKIIPVLPSVARRMFLDRFNELYKGA